MPVIPQDIKLRHVCKCGRWFNNNVGLNNHVKLNNYGEHGDLERLIRECLKRGLLDKAEKFMILKEQYQSTMRRRNRGMPDRKALRRIERRAEQKEAMRVEYMSKLGHPATIGHTAQAKLDEIGLDTRSDQEQCAEVLAESDARLVDVDKLFD